MISKNWNSVNPWSSFEQAISADKYASMFSRWTFPYCLFTQKRFTRFPLRLGRVTLLDSRSKIPVRDPLLSVHSITCVSDGKDEMREENFKTLFGIKYLITNKSVHYFLTNLQYKSKLMLVLKIENCFILNNFHRWKSTNLPLAWYISIHVILFIRCCCVTMFHISSFDISLFITFKY